MAKRLCAYAGCGAVVDRGYCAAHQRSSPGAAAERARGSSTARGYGYRWQQYSRARLRRHPLCVDPDKRHAGRPALAAHTDHIVPVSGPDDPRFWDQANHQSLCESCHSAKTVRENGFGREGGRGSKSSPALRL